MLVFLNTAGVDYLSVSQSIMCHALLLVCSTLSSTHAAHPADDEVSAHERHTQLRQRLCTQGTSAFRERTK